MAAARPLARSVHECMHVAWQVATEAVDTPVDEASSDRGVIHSPGDDATTVGVDAIDECLVQQLPMLPEVASSDIMHRAKRIHRVARLENANRDVRGEIVNASGYPVIEAVNRARATTRADGRDDGVFDSVGLHLDIDGRFRRNDCQKLIESRDSLPADRDRPEGRKVGVGNDRARARIARPGVRGSVVVYDHRAIPRTMHVELDRRSAELERAREGWKGVLAVLAGSATMADDLHDRWVR